MPTFFNSQTTTSLAERPVSHKERSSAYRKTHCSDTISCPSYGEDPAEKSGPNRLLCFKLSIDRKEKISKTPKTTISFGNNSKFMSQTAKMSMTLSVFGKVGLSGASTLITDQVRDTMDGQLSTRHKN